MDFIIGLVLGFGFGFFICSACVSKELKKREKAKQIIENKEDK